MPLRTNLHGKLIVERAVPPDVQAALGRKKLARVVQPHETVAEVQAKLDQMIQDARGSAPVRIVVEITAPRTGIHLAKYEAAIRKALDREIPGLSTPKIDFQFPRGDRQK